MQRRAVATLRKASKPRNDYEILTICGLSTRISSIRPIACSPCFRKSADSPSLLMCKLRTMLWKFMSLARAGCQSCATFGKGSGQISAPSMRFLACHSVQQVVLPTPKTQRLVPCTSPCFQKQTHNSLAHPNLASLAAVSTKGLREAAKEEATCLTEKSLAQKNTVHDYLQLGAGWCHSPAHLAIGV